MTRAGISLYLDAGDHARLKAWAEAAWPEETCGLLLGRGLGGPALTVSQVEWSPNLAPEPERGFEVDPRLLLRLHREGRQQGETMIGVFHSHPTGSPEPSATDLARALDPDLVWLILAVREGRLRDTKVHRLRQDGSGFDEMPWHLLPSESKPVGGKEESRC